MNAFTEDQLRAFEAGRRMTTTITMETAALIWKAHREIEVATKMLTELRDKKKWGEDPNPLDAFGSRKPYTLGIPHGDTGHQLVDLSPELALTIIAAHITRKQCELGEACARATLELSGDLPSLLNGTTEKTKHAHGVAGAA